jgi:hypothetical protein
MRPILIRIGLMVMCLVVVLLLASNPVMSKIGTEIVATKAVNATIVEKPIPTGQVMKVNNANAGVLHALPFGKRGLLVNYTISQGKNVANAAGIAKYTQFPNIPLYPTNRIIGADLTITDVKEYKFKQAEGGPDIYTLDFLVKNNGNAASGVSNIAYAQYEICENCETMDVVRPRVTVPKIEAGQSAHVTTTIYEDKSGCKYEICWIYVNAEEPGCWGDPCIPTPETNYDNNQFPGFYNVPDSSLQPSSIADAIFIKINEIRGEHQKPPLTRNLQLDTVAQGFSDSMAQCTTCCDSHDVCGNNWDPSAGHDCTAAGRCKTILDMGFGSPAECIYVVKPGVSRFVCDQTPITIGDNAISIASYTVLTWVDHDYSTGDCNSPPVNDHRETILGDIYGDSPPTDVGIGVTKGSNGYYYITADFARM